MEKEIFDPEVIDASPLSGKVRGGGLLGHTNAGSNPGLPTGTEVVFTRVDGKGEEGISLRRSCPLAVDARPRGGSGE